MFNKLKFWGNDVIKFYCPKQLEGVLIEPKPAVKCLPEWFKSLSPHATQGLDGKMPPRDQFGEPTMSAKKCLPMLDAMSLGYTIVTSGDVRIITNNNRSKIDVVNPPEMRLIEFHSINQIGGIQSKGAPGWPADAIKFINHWYIETAPGWSTLFISPINQMNPHFTCLGGLVDTDKYPKEVNFPAIWHTPNFDGTIPSGTPIITAIPIKRNSFSRKPKITKITKKQQERIDKIGTKQRMRNHVYTQELRERK